MAGVAGRLALGLQGDVIGRLPSAASSASAAASRAAFSPASRASRTSRDALRSAMRASRARLIACRAACRSAIAGSFVPDLARKFSSSAFFALAAALSRSSKFVLLELSISLHLMRGSVGQLRRCQKTALRDDMTLAGQEGRVGHPDRTVAEPFGVTAG